MAKPGDIYRAFIDKVPPPTEGTLRVWWIPQIPGQQFVWPVNNLGEAALLLDVLAAYDDFQFANRVKGDYSNVGGLVVYRDGDWEDWTNADGDDFDTFRSQSVAMQLAHKS